ncbi:MAG: DUF5683 domain-containing protein [Draconibacterium sp.]
MNAGSFITKLIVVITLFFLCFGAYAQNIEIDSTQTVPLDEEKAEEVHSPRKATIYSAILPGLGQAYNKKYWKIPLIYAGLGTIGYFIHWNNGNYQIMKTAYGDFTDDDPNTTSYLDLDGAQYYDLENSESDRTNFKTNLTRQQDYYRRNRDLLFISMIGFYGLNIIDASVDAHFFDFDISEDLTMNWQPTMNYFNNQPVYGLNLSFTF